MQFFKKITQTKILYKDSLRKQNKNLLQKFLKLVPLEQGRGLVNHAQLFPASGISFAQMTLGRTDIR